MKTIRFCRKADIAVFLAAAAAAVCLFAGAGLLSGKTMKRPALEILTGNQVFGVYDLTEDRTIRIGETNVCEIRDGEVRMTEADCPDRICIHSAAITAKGGSIVCLPNHIVLRVTDANDSMREVDTIAE